MRSEFRQATLRMSGVLALGIGLCSISQAATVPDYFFNGPITFSASGNTLSVNTGTQGAEIFSSTGVPAPFAVIPTNLPGSNIAGSQIFLSLTLVPSSVHDNGSTTTASFTTPTGYQAALYLGNGSGGTASTPVLTGTLSDMQVSGTDGFNIGVLTGFLHPTGGSAFAFFSNPSDVIALDFNLSTNFSASMYQSAFSGQINGQVESVTAPVPLPATLPMLVSGLGLLAAAARRRRQSLAAVSWGSYKFGSA